MKIRTDFVTNSSSSCFCVQLLLQFDNQYALYMDASSQKGDPDVWETFDECEIIHTFSGKGLHSAHEIVQRCECKESIGMAQNGCAHFDCQREPAVADVAQ